MQGLNLEIEANKITAIMGPSGIGKTTILKLLIGQLKPTQGEVFFKGQLINNLPIKKIYDLRKNMGILFQSGALFTDINVFDNISFPLVELTKLSKKEIEQKTTTIINAVGLKGTENLMPSSLSGGMARRVAFARAIVHNPEVVMFDEPFTGQDPISMGILIKLIQYTRTQKITSIIVSHDIEETFAIADKVFIIYNGKVIISGSPEIIKNSKNPAVKQFIQGLPEGPIGFNYN